MYLYVCWVWSLYLFSIIHYDIIMEIIGIIGIIIIGNVYIYYNKNNNCKVPGTGRIQV